MTMTVVRVGFARGLQRRLELGDAADLVGVGAETCRMRGEIDVGQRHVAGVLEQVVEALRRSPAAAG